MRRLFASLLLVAACAVLAAGCGGGSSRNKAYSGSKAAYAAALDSLCASAKEKARDLDMTTTAAIAKHGGQAGDILDTLAQQVDKLEPPAAQKQSAQSFTDGLHTEADHLGDLRDAAKANDTAKVQKIQGQLASEAAATSETARFLGATGCARLFT